MLDLADLKPGDTVYDLGAGDGRLLRAAKLREPTLMTIGYEILPLVWLLGRCRSWWAGTRDDLRLGSFFTADISDADVVLTYLYPEIMEKLAVKLDLELKPGTRVVANAFGFTHREPVERRDVDIGKGTREVLVYQW